MTLYLAFSAIDAGALRLDQVLTVSAHAAGQPGSRLGLTAAENITVQQAILAVITRSGNDAAMALAEAVAGNEGAFVLQMNERASALGLVQTHFVNPTGLPDPRQITSARDMASLALALWRKYPDFYHFFNARGMRLRGGNLPTINGFLITYRGADGLKTGTTCDAGYNLVASAERNGVRLIGVVLGAPNGAARSDQMAALLDKGFASTVDQARHPPNDQSPASSEIGWSDRCHGQAPAAKVSPGLPGWGLVLGAYAREIPAYRAIDLARNAVKLPRETGQPRVTRDKHDKYFTALLVDMPEVKARAACLELRRRGAYCIVLDPTELNNPDAAWRG